MRKEISLEHKRSKIYIRVIQWTENFSTLLATSQCNCQFGECKIASFTHSGFSFKTVQNQEQTQS